MAAAMFGDTPMSFTLKKSIQQRVKSKIIFLLSNHLFLLYFFLFLDEIKSFHHFISSEALLYTKLSAVLGGIWYVLVKTQKDWKQS